MIYKIWPIYTISNKLPETDSLTVHSSSALIWKPRFHAVGSASCDIRDYPPTAGPGPPLDIIGFYSHHSPDSLAQDSKKYIAIAI